MLSNSSKSINLSKFLLFLSISSVIFSCSSMSDKEQRIKDIESIQGILFEDPAFVKEGTKRNTEMQTLREYYKQFVTAYPSDTLSGLYIYNLAMMEADHFKRYDESVKYLERFVREFPNHRNAPKALFLEGFTYAEYLKDYKRAEAIYNRFIQLYPNHEMVPSIQFELQNLGKTPEELLNNQLNNHD
jgi:outer membrane protein assembly factor BamD (BamD/ComL family)